MTEGDSNLSGTESPTTTFRLKRLNVKRERGGRGRVECGGYIGHGVECRRGVE